MGFNIAQHIIKAQQAIYANQTNCEEASLNLNEDEEKAASNKKNHNR